MQIERTTAPALEPRAWIDVSVPVRGGMVTWPDNPKVVLERTLRREEGAAANVSRLSLGVHTGTHVDAPVHFLDGGAGIDETPLEKLIGLARVIDVGNVAAVDCKTLLAHDPARGERLLLRTTNSVRCWSAPAFVPDYVYLTPDGATLLAERRVATVGIDYLSIGGPDDGEETHVTLLRRGICVIEGLDLSRVSAGLYELICLPLRIAGCDGAPARVVLRKRRSDSKPPPKNPQTGAPS